MKLLLKLSLAFIMVLVVAEVLLRGIEMSHPPEQRFERKILHKFYTKVVQEVYNPKKVHFYQVPFMSFENFRIDDEKYIREVYEQSMGPVGTNAITENNLTDSKEQFRYSLNKLGFRGPDRDLKKKPGSYRILTLGSYQAWGIGVNDEETYAALLEKEFSFQNTKLNVEVWNAGRNSSKAVTGLAQLTHGILDINPDLVILDYGFCDSLRVRPDPRLMLSDEQVNLKKIGIHSFLLREIEGYMSVKPQFDHPLDGFRTVMNKMISLLQARGINVLLVEHPAYFTDQLRPYFREAENQGIPLFRVQDAFDAHPPKAEDWATTEWIKDVPADIRKKVVLLRDAPYKITPFHLNGRGNAVMARGLKTIILEKKLLTRIK